MLVGLMGTGKSTVGRRVAELCRRPFVDIDERVAASAGSSIPVLFEREGEAGFRDRETAALAAALADAVPAVIATGGGVVERPDNRALLVDAHVVWLRASVPTMVSRVGSGAGRPLLGADPEADLLALTERRRPWLAEIADAVVDVDGLDSEHVALVLAEALR